MTDEAKTAAIRAVERLMEEISFRNAHIRELSALFSETREILIREKTRFHMREFVIGYLAGAAVLGLCVIVHNLTH